METKPKIIRKVYFFTSAKTRAYFLKDENSRKIVCEELFIISKNFAGVEKK